MLAHGKPAWEGSSSNSIEAVIDVDHAVRTPRRLRRVVPAACVRSAPAEGVWLDPAGRPDSRLGGVVHPPTGVSSALLQAGSGRGEAHHGGAGQEEGRADHCDSGGGDEGEGRRKCEEENEDGAHASTG